MVKLQPRPAGAPGTVRADKLAPSKRLENNSENLGTNVIEGIVCHGLRRTVIIPSGYMGNEKPLKRMTETWMSDEIHLPVLFISDGDDSGRTTHRLKEIKLGEPDPSLFQIPTGYSVEKEN